MTYYIRTGDKISQPFTIPAWVKILVVGFACYFVWITVEYVKMYYLVPEIARIEAEALAKYEVAVHLDALGVEIDETNGRVDAIKELIQKEFANELPSNR
jgi:hypothetical protein